MKSEDKPLDMVVWNKLRYNETKAEKHIKVGDKKRRIYG